MCKNQFFEAIIHIRCVILLLCSISLFYRVQCKAQPTPMYTLHNHKDQAMCIHLITVPLVCS